MPEVSPDRAYMTETDPSRPRQARRPPSKTHTGPRIKRLVLGSLRQAEYQPPEVAARFQEGCFRDRQTQTWRPT